MQKLYHCGTVYSSSILLHFNLFITDAGAFWRVVEEHGVNALFSAPTAFRAIRQADPDGLMTKKYDLSSLRTVFVAGERSDPSTLHWMEDILQEYNVPAIDHWWQTELAFPGAGK